MFDLNESKLRLLTVKTFTVQRFRVSCFWEKIIIRVKRHCPIYNCEHYGKPGFGSPMGDDCHPNSSRICVTLLSHL